MKYLLLAGAFLGVIGYAWTSGGDPNVYPLSQADVYAKLRAAPVQKGNAGLFGNLDTSVSGNGDSKVYWNAGGNHCEAEITPEDKASRIMAFCGGGSMSDGAAMGMVSAMHRHSLIEHIDAALTNRAFEPKRALGSTAARWPSDSRQPDGSYGTAVGNALKMDRDMHTMIRDMDKATAEDRARAANNPNAQFQAGKPMVDLGSSSR